MLMVGVLVVLVSIHAPAWGATWTTPKRILSRASFNSRARVGRDHLGAAWRLRVVVSIHAPAWGATYRPYTNHSVYVSIHAPAWGATASAAFAQ